MFRNQKVSLVLGGGGTKGLAHIGVLKALQRWGIVPDEYVGTSVGSLICAMSASGMTPVDVEKAALAIRRRDILDYDWRGLILRRGGTRSLYLGTALTNMVHRIVPVHRFDQLPTPAFFTSVEVNTGREVIWGSAGLREHSVPDCVVASCSVPGIYPPKAIGGYHFVDGSLIDTLPIKVAVRNGAGLIIAVFLDDQSDKAVRVDRLGIGAILEQCQAVIARTYLRYNIDYHSDAPLVLIQPRVPSIGMFQFHRTREVIAEGERAAEAVLREHPLTKAIEPAAADEATREVA